jgi:hypothetical protein
LRSAQDATLAPAYRVVLLSLLVAPIGGVLVQANVLRDLVMVIPAALLTTIGLAAVLDWIVRYTGSTQRTFHAAAIIVCAVLILANFFMLHDVLTNGPTWYDNYGLTGLQYGGPQVFTAIRDYLEREPGTEVWLFPSWLNGSEMLKRYFLPDDPRVQLLDFDGFLASKFDLTDQTLLVMDHANYQRLIDSGKFAGAQIERTISLPNGLPGYHLLTARYSPDIDRLLQQEHQALEQAEVVVNGETWQVSHTALQNGIIQNLFDRNPDTSMTTRGNNLAIIDITLPEPRSIAGLTLASDNRELQLAIEVYADRAAQAGRYESTFTQLQPDQPIEVEFDPPPGAITRLRLTIKGLDGVDAVTLRDFALIVAH